MEFEMTVDFYGLDDTRAYIDDMPRRVNERTLSTLNKWGQRFTKLGQILSPTDKYRAFDARRTKNKPFRVQWQYDLSATRDEAVLRIGNVDPRMPWIIWKTRPRGVIPKGGAAAMKQRGYPLRFYTADGTIHHQWEVRGGIAAHGTPGNPVHEKMLQRFGLEGALRFYSAWIIQP